MFDKLFKRKKTETKPSEAGNIPTDPRKLAFKMLILSYLEKYGIDEDGNKSLVVKTRNEEDEKRIK